MRAGALALAAATLALGLAGCTVALPQAHEPEDPGHRWTEPKGDLWVARKAACGECEWSTESPNRELLLLYRDGSVLHALYGEGGQEQIEGYPAAEGDRRGLTFLLPGDDEAHRDEVTDAWTAMHGQPPHLVRVHQVHAYALDPTEREDVLRVVEHALRQTRDLDGTFQDGCPADATCFDGVEVTFWAWGAPRASGPHAARSGQADDAWRLLEAQAAALEAWLAEQAGHQD